MISRLKRFLIAKKINHEGGQKISSIARTMALNNNVDIGMYTYGSCFSSEFNLGGKVKIGRYCSFGPNVRYFGANHPISYACMSPYFYRKEWGLDVTDVERHSLEIGNDCWIGNNVTIVSSCHSIGDGAVIAAGAVVTNDVPPYSIVGGVPGKILKYRFDEETISILLKSEWWQLTPEELFEYYRLIEKPFEWAKAIVRDNHSTVL